MQYRIGIDVGGTFTDFLVIDSAGSGRVFKSSSTPKDPSIGVMNGIEEAARSYGLSVGEFLERTELIVHGTTVTTNAVLTSSGAKTGLITTAGFRDILEMRKGIRKRLYDNKTDPPVPLVPRRLRIGVEERVDCEGRIVTPLKESDVRNAARLFKDEGVESVAVSTLFSFYEPCHERRIAEILGEEMPGVYISLSSEILPEIREYERTSTVVLNSYVGPILRRYLISLADQLKKRGFKGVLLIMQSNGGVMSPSVAAVFSSNTLLSGPAAGPLSGLFYAGYHGWNDIITVDMGGTSFDACLVQNGVPLITTEGEISEYRIASPMVDIATIGAGGGSIAWIDDTGLLQVGPKSAGADPGPACYGRGGTKPTVTDADLILGYLDPDYFLGGSMTLRTELSRSAIRSVAEPLGIDEVEAAAGIFDIVNSNMADGVRLVSVRRGYDPREFVLVVAGGAGPIHAGAIALELEIPLIVIPRESSVFCAVGMLLSDLRHDVVRTYKVAFDRAEKQVVRQIYEEMRQKGKEMLSSERVRDDQMEFRCSASLRYMGQIHEIDVEVTDDEIRGEDFSGVLNRFHDRHETLYGYSDPAAPVEIVNLRLSAVGHTPKPIFPKERYVGPDSSHAVKGYREVYFKSAKSYVSTLVYDGLRLGYGCLVRGPAIIEQPNTSILVMPEYDVECDAYGSYIMYPKGKRPMLNEA